MVCRQEICVSLCLYLTFRPECCHLDPKSSFGCEHLRFQKRQSGRLLDRLYRLNPFRRLPQTGCFSCQRPSTKCKYLRDQKTEHPPLWGCFQMEFCILSHGVRSPRRGCFGYPLLKRKSRARRLQKFRLPYSLN